MIKNLLNKIISFFKENKPVPAGYNHCIAATTNILSDNDLAEIEQILNIVRDEGMLVIYSSQEKEKLSHIRLGNPNTINRSDFSTPNKLFSPREFLSLYQRVKERLDATGLFKEPIFCHNQEQMISNPNAALVQTLRRAGQMEGINDPRIEQMIEHYTNEAHYGFYQTPPTPEYTGSVYQDLVYTHPYGLQVQYCDLILK
jgi:hypothetical protein